MTQAQTHILELFGELPPDQQRELALRIYRSAIGERKALALSVAERALLEASRRDFLSGRTVSQVEMQAETDAFLSRQSEQA